MKNTTSLKCPRCESLLISLPGNQISPQAGGFTLYCENRTCPVPEIAGYGKTVEQAFEVINHKFKK